MRAPKLSYLLFIFAFWLISNGSFSASTTNQPTIDLDHLDLLLDPLTKEDLSKEVVAWQGLVKSKVQQISLKEIASRKKKDEIEAIEEEIDAIAEEQEDKAQPIDTKAAENKQEIKEIQKENILQSLTELREQKTALLDRFKLVIDAYEDKGGEVKEYRMYARAVEGIKVEVTDTNATWAAIKGWVMSREGGLKLGFNTLKFLSIIFVFYVLAKLVGKMVRKATSSSYRLSALLKSFINTMAQRTVFFIGLLVAFSTLGVEVGALLALVGGSAFIIGFALQDTLGNFAAGLMLLIYRPFDEGDIVEVGGVSGQVDKVSLVSTTIRTFDNKIVLVPNKQVWGQVITNATASDKRRVDLIFGISYEDDIDTAKGLIEEIVKRHELVLEEPAPVVELHTLGESSVDFICRPWTNTANYWRVYWDVTEQVKKTFDANGVSIPFPQRDLHLYYPNQEEPPKQSATPKIEAPAPKEENQPGTDKFEMAD